MRNFKSDKGSERGGRDEWKRVCQQRGEKRSGQRKKNCSTLMTSVAAVPCMVQLLCWHQLG